MKYNILFVCLGNICRSPMAEMIFKDLINQNNMQEYIQCESRATSTAEYGNDMYPEAVKALQQHNIPVQRNVVSMVKPEDYEKYNYIICMDYDNYDDLLMIFRGDPKKKVHLLMEYAGKNEEEIADPWYTGDFETAYAQIYEGCISLFQMLMEKYEENKN